MRIVDDNILTPREKEIIILLLQGKSKNDIANILFLSISIIKTNVEHIYQKFNVHNKVQLIFFLIKEKMIEFEQIE